ncbi:hypothetical protein [Bradyrhizobium sp.]|uniref:hypothetical protein n=1 Tax=Bradyrhizobium sp. TaxID=376 RepID=UPI00261D8F62|nr:hypothetical protein [Bradyrhizobium sp.]
MASVLDFEDIKFICDGNRVHPSAIPDVRARYAHEEVNEPLSLWLPKQRETSPHWFQPEPKAEGEEDEDVAVFTNADAQAAFAREHGTSALTAKLAERGLKVGQVVKAIKKEPSADATKPSTNPWHPSWKNGDAAARQAEQLRIIRQSTKLATSLAKAAGVTISGQPLRGR